LPEGPKTISPFGEMELEIGAVGVTPDHDTGI